MTTLLVMALVVLLVLATVIRDRWLRLGVVLRAFAVGETGLSFRVGRLAAI